MMTGDWDLKSIGEIALLAWGVLSTALVGWLSKSFASKAKLDELAAAVRKAEADLAAGANRFTKLEGAIRQVEHAATEAKDAAETAMAAAEKVHGTEVELARLNGAIEALEAALEPIKHLTLRMVDGHMVMGGKP